MTTPIKKTYLSPTSETLEVRTRGFLCGSDPYDTEGSDYTLKSEQTW